MGWPPAVVIVVRYVDLSESYLHSFFIYFSFSSAYASGGKYHRIMENIQYVLTFQ